MKRIISLVLVIVMILSLGLVASSCSGSDSGGTGGRRRGNASGGDTSTASDNGTSGAGSTQSGTGSTQSGTNSQGGGNQGGTNSQGGGNQGGTNSQGGGNQGGTNSQGGGNQGGTNSTPEGLGDLNANEIQALTNTGTVRTYSGIWEGCREGNKTEGNDPAVFKKFNEYFKNQYGGNLEFIECDWSKWETQYFQDFAAGTAPELVYLFERNWPIAAMNGQIYSIAELESNGVQLLNSPALEEHLDAVQKLYTYNNNTYTFANYLLEPDMMFVNEKLFKDLGLKSPTAYYKEGKWNMNQFIECASQVTRDSDQDGKTDLYGYFTWDLYMIVGNNAGTTVEVSKTSKDLRVAVDDPATKKGLDYIRELYAVKKGGLIVSDNNEGAKLFDNGKIGMTSWLPRNEFSGFRHISDHDWAKNGNWSIIPMPLGENNKSNARSAKCYSWAVSKSATDLRQQQAAVNVIIAYNSWINALGNEDPLYQNTTYLAKYYNAEQMQIIKDCSKNVSIPVHQGITGVSLPWLYLYQSIMKGETVQAAIETYKPQIEGAVEAVMNNM